MAQTSVDIPQLKFNKMSTAKYNELKKAGQLVENEFYITPDGGTIPEVNTNTNQQILSNDGTNLIWRNEQVGYKQITNCITEIPQDIKLELVDGTLTLKAGSKVYVPNGAGKFDEVIIPSDISRTIVWNGPGFITCESNNSIDWANINYCFSGDAAPDNPNGGWLWYDTANNIIKRYNGSEWTTQKSLPIAILNSSTTQSEQSIDQIFNGFGYIGSTVFALPGVKGLIPNGRNEDGSLKSVEFSYTSVTTLNTVSASGDFGIYSLSNVLAQTASVSYYENENFNIDVSGEQVLACKSINISTDSSGKITSFTQKTTFHAVDNNDSSWLSGLGMPSNRYIDLTIGASPTQFTAPANGWFNVWAKGGTTSNNKYLEIINNTTGIAQGVYGTTNYHYKCHLPARKGDKITVQYNNMESAPDRCRFVYAEGEN